MVHRFPALAKPDDNMWATPPPQMIASTDYPRKIVLMTDINYGNVVFSMLLKQFSSTDGLFTIPSRMD